MKKFSLKDFKQLLRYLLAPGPVLILFLLAGCFPKETSAPAPSTYSRSTATPTSPAGSDILSEQQKLSLAEFAKGLASLERDWDSFHKSYNDWFRTRNIPMEPDMEKSLGQLVNRFQQIKGRIVEIMMLEPPEDVHDFILRNSEAFRNIILAENVTFGMVGYPDLILYKKYNYGDFLLVEVKDINDRLSSSQQARIGYFLKSRIPFGLFQFIR